MTAEVEVGAETAQALPTLFDAMAGVQCTGIMDDPEKLHAAIIARREWVLAEAKLLTQWAETVRAREAEATSQRKAARLFGLSRVRPKK